MGTKGLSPLKLWIISGYISNQILIYYTSNFRALHNMPLATLLNDIECFSVNLTLKPVVRKIVLSYPKFPCLPWWNLLEHCLFWWWHTIMYLGFSLSSRIIQEIMFAYLPNYDNMSPKEHMLMITNCIEKLKHNSWLGDLGPPAKKNVRIATKSIIHNIEMDMLGV